VSIPDRECRLNIVGKGLRIPRKGHDGTRIRGFSLLLLGEGLIIADALDVGLELQRWHFPVQEHLLMFDGNLAHEHLTKQD